MIKNIIIGQESFHSHKGYNIKHNHALKQVSITEENSYFCLGVSRVIRVLCLENSIIIERFRGKKVIFKF